RANESQFESGDDSSKSRMTVAIANRLTRRKKMRKKLALPGRFALATVSVFSALVVMLPSASLTADRPLQKINVAYSSISGNQAALWVAQDKGFFRKYGLEVQAVLIESGTTTSQALVSGDLPFANVAGPAVIQSNLRGADAVIIAGVLNTLIFQLYTDKTI